MEVCMIWSWSPEVFMGGSPFCLSSSPQLPSTHTHTRIYIYPRALTHTLSTHTLAPTIQSSRPPWMPIHWTDQWAEGQAMPILQEGHVKWVGSSLMKNCQSSEGRISVLKQAKEPNRIVLEYNHFKYRKVYFVTSLTHTRLGIFKSGGLEG